MKLDGSRQNFENYSSNISWKNMFSRSQMFHADRQRQPDIAKLIVAFNNSANRLTISEKHLSPCPPPPSYAFDWPCVKGTVHRVEHRISKAPVRSDNRYHTNCTIHNASTSAAGCSATITVLHIIFLERQPPWTSHWTQRVNLSISGLQFQNSWLQFDSDFTVTDGKFSSFRSEYGVTLNLLEQI